MESRSRVPLAALAAALLVAGACGETAPTTPSPQPGTSPLTVALTTAHFRILTDDADTGVLRGVADALEGSYARITGELRTGDIAVTDAWVWQDQAAYYADMQRMLGVVYQGSAGWVRGGHAISLLVVSKTSVNAVHEFAHVVSLGVNPTIANNPRWLWETVALYENREFVDPARLDYLKAGQFPTLAELDADFNAGRRVYDLGYVLGEFIVSTWGLDGFLALIRTNGLTQSALQVPRDVFEQRWQQWLRDKYLGQSKIAPAYFRSNSVNCQRSAVSSCLTTYTSPSSPSSLK